MKKKVNFVYSIDEELFNYNSEEECIDALLNNYLSDEEIKEAVEKQDCLEFEKGVEVPYKASSFVDKWLIQDLLENMNIRATDNCGESAEYFALDVSDEAINKLEKYIKSWADKNLTCAFYGVKDITKVSVKLTPELIKEYLE